MSQDIDDFLEELLSGSIGTSLTSAAQQRNNNINNNNNNSQNNFNSKNNSQNNNQANTTTSSASSSARNSYTRGGNYNSNNNNNNNMMMMMGNNSQNNRRHQNYDDDDHDDDDADNHRKHRHNKEKKEKKDKKSLKKESGKIRSRDYHDDDDEDDDGNNNNDKKSKKRSPTNGQQMTMMKIPPRPNPDQILPSQPSDDRIKKEKSHRTKDKKEKKSKKDKKKDRRRHNSSSGEEEEDDDEEEEYEDDEEEEQQEENNQPQLTWACSVCTFENSKMKAKKCEMCDTARGLRVCANCNKSTQSIVCGTKCPSCGVNALPPIPGSKKAPAPKRVIKKEKKPKKEKKSKKSSRRDDDGDDNQDRNDKNRNDSDAEDELLLLGLPSSKKTSDTKKLTSSSSSSASDSGASKASRASSQHSRNGANKENGNDDDDDDKSSFYSDESETDESELETSDSDSSDSLDSTSSDESSSYNSNNNRRKGNKNLLGQQRRQQPTAADGAVSAALLDEEDERERREIEDDPERMQAFLEGLNHSIAHDDIAPAPCPLSMVAKASLKEYQLQGLAWMLGREGCRQFGRAPEPIPEPDARQGQLPLPADGAVPPLQQQQQQQQQNPQGGRGAGKNNAPLLNNRQQLEERERIARDNGSKTRGGIQSDQMGLGKSRQMIALAETTLPQARRDADVGFMAGGKIRSRATLIVCPVAVVTNWINEIRKTVSDRRSILRYHGAARKATMFTIADHDYVVTTYHTIAQDLKMSEGRPQACPLSMIEWHRIVLDEAHVIRNPCSQACCLLHARFRWAVTATPFVNRVDDFFPLCKFLNVPFFSGAPWWRENITGVISAAYALSLSESVDDQRVGERDIQRAIFPLQTLLAGLMMRRTIDTRNPQTGEAIITLPSKTIHLVPIRLSRLERTLYDQVFDGAVMRISEIAKFNPAGFSNSGLSFDMSPAEYKRRLFATAFEMLARCRQACGHVFLMVRSMQQKRGTKTDRIEARDSGVYRLLGGNDQLNSMRHLEERLAGQMTAPAVSAEEAIRIATEALQKQQTTFKQNLFQRLEQIHKVRAKRPAGKAKDDKGRANDGAALPTFIREKVLEFIQNGAKFDEPCIICLDEPVVNPAFPPCGHIACDPCLRTAIQQSQKCPLCRKETKVAELINLQEEYKKAEQAGEVLQKRQEEEQKPDIIDTLNLGPLRSWLICAKALQLLELLSSFPDDETHVLVFSQSQQFLEYLNCVLGQHGHQTYAYNGGMSMRQRDDNIKRFSDPMIAGRFDVNANQNNRKRNQKNNANNRQQQQNQENNNNNGGRGVGHLPIPFGGLGAAPPSRFSIKKEEKVEPEDENLPLGALVRRQEEQQQQQQNRNRNQNDDEDDDDDAVANDDNDQEEKEFRQKKVLLATIQSCGVGLNITAATRCVLLDPCWNLSMEDQAISRIHRIGQDRPVHIYRFYIEKSVEIHMMNLAKAKAEFAEKCLSAVGGPSGGNGGGRNNNNNNNNRRNRGRGGMGLDDLMEIFRGNNDQEVDED